MGAEIVLTVDGEMQRTRLCRAHEQAELSGAIAETLAPFERWDGCDEATAECAVRRCESATAWNFF
jgi:hypothetical protein